MPRRFTQEQEALICLTFLRDHKTLSNLAKEWNCTHSTIINVLERNGIPRKKNKK